ncbi:MAG: hypothetical protein PHS52_00275 [Desulfotomaculaceae bacterium]|nr:hypothetical protein [Desulfotomaculaceae bacterium]
MKTAASNDSGQALILVMMIMLLVLLMGSSMLTLGSESRQASFDEQRIAQAGYIAEAGIEKAMAKIKYDPFWLKGLDLNKEATFIQALGYAGGTITAVKLKRTSSAGNPTRFYIESLGEYQGARRTIQVEGEMYDPIDFSKGIWVKSPLTQLGENCLINSSITCEGAGFPVLEENWYAKNADRVLTGDLAGTFGVDGISYAPGSISITGEYSGKGAIIAGGKVTINGELRMEGEGDSLAVISFESANGIKTSNGSTVYALLYCPGTITVGSGSHVQGSVVCDVIEFGPDSVFTGDQSMPNVFPRWITTTVKVTSWKEKYPVF